MILSIVGFILSLIGLGMNVYALRQFYYAATLLPVPQLPIGAVYVAAQQAVTNRIIGRYTRPG